MKIKHHVPFGIRRGSMKRYIAFLLTALMCTNLCACGAEQAEPEVKETPVIEDVQEVAPTEPVMQEVSVPKEKMSLVYRGQRVVDGEVLYIGTGSGETAVYLGRSRIKDFTIETSNPDILEATIDDSGFIHLKSLNSGECTLTVHLIDEKYSFKVSIPKLIDWNELITEVNDNKHSLTVDSSFYDEFKKYLVNDPATGGMVSVAEINKLTSGTGIEPSTVTYEQAVEDVNLLFRVLKAGYGAYYYFGEAEWIKAEDEVINWLKGQQDISVHALKTKIRESTHFMRDSHSWIGVSAKAWPDFKYEYYYCDTVLSKDEYGYYKIEDGEKWYYESCEDRFVSIAPVLQEDGALVYSLVWFGAQIDFPEMSEINFKNGSKLKTDTITWNISAPYSKDPIHEPDFKYIEENGLGYLSIRCFGEPAYPQIFNDFIQSGKTARNVDVLIIDIRSNGGSIPGYKGGGDSIGRWYSNFTGTMLQLSRVRADRHSVLNGRSMWNSIYQEMNEKGNIVDVGVPIILLVDDNCGSNGESMLEAVKTIDNVLVVGSNSSGYQLGGNGIEINLPYTQIPAYVGTFIQFIKEIKNVDGIGYEPDVWCNPQTALSASLNLIKQYGLADEAAVSAMAKQLGVNL